MEKHTRSHIRRIPNVELCKTDQTILSTILYFKKGAGQEMREHKENVNSEVYSTNLKQSKKKISFQQLKPFLTCGKVK